MELRRFRVVGAIATMLLFVWYLASYIRTRPILDDRDSPSVEHVTGALRWAGGRYLSGESWLSDVRRLSRVTAKLSHEAKKDPGLVADAALLALVDKKPSVAVTTLENSLRAFPDNAALLNDLAVALVAKANSDDPSSLIGALSAIERSLRAEPLLNEARFNRALILERLSLRSLSLREWQGYQAQERDRHWLDVARAHSANQNKPSLEQDWLERRNSLEIAVREGKVLGAFQLVSRFPQQARTLAQEDLVEAWAQATLDGNSNYASAYLKAALEIGTNISKLNAEHSAIDAVSEIDRAMERNQSEILARAYLDLKEALKLYKMLKAQEAYQILVRVKGSFHSTGSDSSELWADLWLAGSQYYQGNRIQAELAITTLLLNPKINRYPALKARGLWAKGLMKMTEGQFDSALIDLKKALALYVQLGEVENIGSVETLIAESFHFLGEDQEAWRYRLRALEKLRSFPSSVRLHNLLLESSYSLIFAGKPQLALYFSDEDLDIAAKSESPVTRAEAWLGHSRTLLSLGDVWKATKDLDEARKAIAAVPEEAVRHRMIAEADMTEGGFFVEKGNKHRLLALTAAIDYYERQKISSLAAYGRLLRARSLMKLGDDLHAEQDLELALMEYSDILKTINDFRIRVSYREQWQDVFDDIVWLQAKRKGNPMKALYFMERARRGTEDTIPTLRGSDNCVSCSLSESYRSILPSGVTVVEYALLKDQLFIWVLQRGGEDFFASKIDTGRLEEVIESFCNGLRQGYSKMTAGQAQILFDLLIRPVLQQAPNTTRLVIVPDKALCGLPFSALRDSKTGALLVESDAVIEYAESISQFANSLLTSSQEDRRARKYWKVLAIGNPAFNRSSYPEHSNLPGAESEAMAVGALYPESKVLLGTAATRKAVLDALGQADVFHFAGHAVFNSTDPYMSRLFFASEGSVQEEADVIYAFELRNKFKKAKIFVLSACETSRNTGMKRIRSGGIAEALLETGRSAVLAARWKVNDKEAEALLRDFHRQLLGGSSAAMALQMAQRKAVEEGRRSGHNSWSWAAFSLYGEIH
jgi:CHAT domain-containing protein